jgi:hypothetical protein
MDLGVKSGLNEFPIRAFVGQALDQPRDGSLDSKVAYFLNHEYHESARMKLVASLIYRGLCSGGLAADGL